MSNASASTVNQFSSISGQVSPGKPIASISAATTLTAAQSGTLFFIPAVAAAFTISLPPVSSARGVEYLFTASGTLGFDVTIQATTAVIQGTVIAGADNASLIVGTVALANSATIKMLTAAVAGTWIRLVSDGTNWYCSGGPGSKAAPMISA